jgi:energy-coupling factor transporter ATP-binding protein EcfA2
MGLDMAIRKALTETEKMDRQKLIDPFYSVLLNETGPLTPSSPYYVENLHFDADRDPIASIARSVRMADTQGGITYFTGHPGTGKTTELNRLRSILESQGQEVFLVNLEDYLAQGEAPDIENFLIKVAVAFASEVDAKFGVDFSNNTPLKRFWTYLKTTDVHLESVEVKKAKLKLAARTDFAATMKAFSDANPQRWMDDVRTLMAELCLYAKQKAAVSGITVIYDSFERLRPSTSAAAPDFYLKVSELFGAYESLRFAGLNVIYTVPPYLPAVTNVQHNVRLHVLGCVRVHGSDRSPTHPSDEGSGVALMALLLTKRFSRWQEIISSDTQVALALASGGDIRMYLRQVVLQLLDRAYSAPEPLPFTPQSRAVADQLKQFKNEMNGLLADSEVAILQRVSTEQTLQVSVPSDQATVARLFDQRLLLSYANGTQWVDAHPAVWDRKPPPKDDAVTKPAAPA